MPVTLRVYATLIEIVGSRVRKVPIASGETIEELLRKTGLYDTVIENGKVRSMYKVLVNGRDIEFLDGLKTKLKDGDVIDVFPPVAGG